MASTPSGIELSSVTFALMQNVYYLYSTLAQVAGALVGFAALGFIFVGNQPDRVVAFQEHHGNQMVIAAIGGLVGVVVASSLILHGDGTASSIGWSRVILGAAIAPSVGAFTYWVPFGRKGAEGVPTDKKRLQWTVRIITGICYVVFPLLSWWVPSAIRHHQSLEGIENLILALLGLTAPVAMGLLAFIQHPPMTNLKRSQGGPRR